MGLLYWALRATAITTIAVFFASYVSSQDYTQGLSWISVGTSFLEACVIALVYAPTRLLRSALRFPTYIASAMAVFLLLLIGTMVQSFYLDPMVSHWPGVRRTIDQSGYATRAFAICAWALLGFTLSLAYAIPVQLPRLLSAFMIFFWSLAFALGFGVIGTEGIFWLTMNVEAEFPRGFSLFPPILRIPDSYAEMFGTPYFNLKYASIIGAASLTASFVAGAFLVFLGYFKYKEHIDDHPFDEEVSPSMSLQLSDKITNKSLPMPKERKNNFWYVRNDSDTVLIFLHGIFSSSRSCWLSTPQAEGDPVFWPDLVRMDHRIGNPSIYLAGYHTAVDAGDYSLRQCAREVMDALENEGFDGSPPVLKYQKLIFVCHSTGGIIARYILDRHLEKFETKAIGLVLIASPSTGSVWANVAKLAAKYYNQQLAAQLRQGSELLNDLHGRFRDLVDSRSSRIPGLFGMEACENQMILRDWIPRWLRPLVPPRLKIVTTLAAGQYFGEVKELADTNHFTTVKPTDISHPAHEFIVTFCSRFRTFVSGLPPGTFTPRPIGTALMGGRNEKNGTERVLFDSTQRPDLGYDFRGSGGQFWQRVNGVDRPVGPAGRGNLKVEAGVLEINRTNIDGRYEVWLESYIVAGQELSLIPADNSLTEKRRFRISFEAKVKGGEHTLQFILKNEKTNIWLDHTQKRITENLWTPDSVYLAIPRGEECKLRIDDLEVSAIPSKVQIRNVVLAEKLP